jgi:uncharacterized SAM-binding protein YcdF (DUF218 family)
LLLLVVAVGATAYATRERWLPGVARLLDVGGPPVRADYAFIASGDVQSRPYAAALLYKHGYVRKVLLTRPTRHAGSAKATAEFDALARAILEHVGVKPGDIELLPGNVATTMDEARLLATRLAREPQATCVVVTSDYHTRRTLWACRRAWAEGTEQLHAFSAPVDYYNAANWWRTPAGPTTCLSEYLRLGFYYVRYGTAAYWIAGIGAALLVAIFASRYLLRDFFARRGGGCGGRYSAISAK